MGTLSTVALVVPCYNEAERLDLDAFNEAVERSQWLRIIFVDDGSRDETAQILTTLGDRHPQQVSLVRLRHNSGKAEAVRQGLLVAFATNVDVVGYWDADLSAPLHEIPAMLEALDSSGADLLLGSRVKLLGRQIDRQAHRHLLGRVFASLASLALDLEVYDTQCGAKLMRNLPEIRAAFDRPFLSRWIFDVEILGRLLRQERSNAGPAVQVVEYPLKKWTFVPGSRLHPGDFVRAGFELARITYYLRR